MKDKIKVVFSFVIIFVFIGCSNTNIALQNNDVVALQNKDFYDENVLHDAVRVNDLDLVKFLIKQNIQKDIQDKYGYTALHIAVRLGSFEISQYLIENDANVNSVDVYKDTPLIDSIRNNDTELSKLLICNGANRNVVDKNRMSTLNYSTKNNNKYISELLRAQNLNTYCKEAIFEFDPLANDGYFEKKKPTEIMFSFDSLEKIPTKESKVCGTIQSDDIDKIEVNLYDKIGTTFGKYIANIDIENKTWCVDIKDYLNFGEYSVTAKAFDKYEQFKIIKEKLYIKATSEIYLALKDEFERDFTNWNATLDEQTLTLRLKNTSILFDASKASLKSSFKEMLEDFLPRYVDVLLYFQEEIESVSIQGHSSSEYSKAATKEGKYLLNKILSQERADEVLKYMKNIDAIEISQNSTWIESTFKSLGKSSDNLIYDEDGKEDAIKSRRIEFVIQLTNK